MFTAILVKHNHEPEVEQLSLLRRLPGTSQSVENALKYALLLKNSKIMTDSALYHIVQGSRDHSRPSAPQQMPPLIDPISHFDPSSKSTVPTKLTSPQLKKTAGLQQQQQQHRVCLKAPLVIQQREGI